MKTVAFFNNKGGVGKTSLVYHIAWMLWEMGHRVVVADFDPQANLTTFFMSDEKVDDLFGTTEPGTTIFQAFSPILEGTGDLAPIVAFEAANGLYLIPGDLALSEAEDELSDRWTDCLSDNKSSKSRAFRTECAFYRAVTQVAHEKNAQIVLIDVGPNLGPLNRAALVASDYVVIPLGSDAFSLQGLRNVGRRLKSWRSEWAKRLEGKPDNLGFTLPQGGMKPIGYLLSRFSIRKGRQSEAYRKWARMMPGTYAEFVLDSKEPVPTEPEADPNCLAELKDYRSLMPMAQTTNKPIFKLQANDGAIGAHQSGVSQAREDFRTLTNTILDRIGAD
jgi:chromosome partitioning protein